MTESTHPMVNVHLKGEDTKSAAEWAAAALAARDEGEAELYAMYAGQQAHGEGAEIGDCPFSDDQAALGEKWRFMWRCCEKAVKERLNEAREKDLLI